MSKRRFGVILSFLVFWVIFTIFAVTWGTRVDWPDYVHIDYGLPLVWTTHTLSTITGPVNIWKVDISALILDLAFWLGMMLITASIIWYFSNRKFWDE